MSFLTCWQSSACDSLNILFLAIYQERFAMNWLGQKLIIARDYIPAIIPWRRTEVQHDEDTSPLLGDELQQVIVDTFDNDTPQASSSSAHAVSTIPASRVNRLSELLRNERLAKACVELADSLDELSHDWLDSMEMKHQFLLFAQEVDKDMSRKRIKRCMFHVGMHLLIAAAYTAAWLLILTYRGLKCLEGSHSSDCGYDSKSGPWVAGIAAATVSGILHALIIFCRRVCVQRRERYDSDVWELNTWQNALRSVIERAPKYQTLINKLQLLGSGLDATNLDEQVADVLASAEELISEHGSPVEQRERCIELTFALIQEIDTDWIEMIAEPAKDLAQRYEKLHKSLKVLEKQAPENQETPISVRESYTAVAEEHEQVKEAIEKWRVRLDRSLEPIGEELTETSLKLLRRLGERDYSLANCINQIVTETQAIRNHYHSCANRDIARRFSHQIRNNINIEI